MSLGFNLGQTGNASESGAGIVKKATEAQISAGQGDDGGVPLYVGPDRLPNANILPGLIAGENITAGQAVSQVFQTYTPLAGNPVLDYQTDDGTELDISSQNNWYAMEYTTPADMSRLKDITIRCRVGAVVGLQVQCYVRLAADLNGGPNVTSFTFPDPGASSTTTVSLNDINRVLDPSTTYYFCFRVNINGYNMYIRTDTSNPQAMYASTDGGATFSVSGVDAPFISISGDEIDVAEDQLVPTDSLSLTEAGNSRINFLGFATQSVLKGEECPVDFGTVVKVVGASFTPGSDYYLTDTGGVIDTTPGTYERLVGRAISTDTLIRARGRVSKHYNIGAQARAVTHFFVMGSGSGGTTNPSVDGTTISGVRGLAMMPKRGEQFNGTNQTWVAVFDAGSPF